MANIKSLLRKLAIRRRRSNVATGLFPLASLKSVNVFMDIRESGAAKLVSELKSFFAGYGLDIRIYSILSPEDVSVPEIEGVTLIPAKKLSLIGTVRNSAKHPVFRTGEDMVVNLTDGDFAADYACVCSQSKMKLGRTQVMGNDIYDIRIINAEGYEQSMVFSQMAAILTGIR